MSDGMIPHGDKLVSYICWYEPAKVSFVALGYGREIRLFSVSNSSDGTMSHVADFDFDNEVLAVHICAISKGVIVTNVNCNGVGWSWIDGHALTVEKTEFQEILHDGLPVDVKESECAAVAYMDLSNRFVLGIGSALFLTSKVDTFASDIVVQSPLASFTGLAWGGKGVLLYNLQEYGVAGVEKWDSEYSKNEYLVMRALRAGAEDSPLSSNACTTRTSTSVCAGASWSPKTVKMETKILVALLWIHQWKISVRMSSRSLC